MGLPQLMWDCEEIREIINGRLPHKFKAQKKFLVNKVIRVFSRTPKEFWISIYEVQPHHKQ